MSIPLEAELAEIRKQLTSLAGGQASLVSAIGQYQRNIEVIFAGLVPSQRAAADADSSTESMPVQCEATLRELENAKQVRASSRAAEEQGLENFRASLQAAEDQSPARSEPSPELSGPITQGATERRIDRLARTLRHDEMPTKTRLTRAYSRRIIDRLRRSSLNEIGEWVVLGMITANSVTLTLELDAKRDPDTRIDAWAVAGIVFSCIFWLELLIKVGTRGFRGHFWGRNRFFNIFEGVLVGLDTVQIIIALTTSRERTNGMPPASVFRCLRLLRLLRLVHVMRSPLMMSLKTMAFSFLGGMPTLGWAAVFMLCILWITGLVCRELFGHGDVQDLSAYFDSVPRSTFTVFRCNFIGDCTTKDGVSIPEVLTEEYGHAATVTSFLYFLVITVGFFNVMTAMFLEKTTEVATKMREQELRRKLADKDLWARGVSLLIRKLIQISSSESDLSPECKLSEHMSEIMQLKIERSDLNQMAMDDLEAANIMLSLDVDPDDFHRLGDILDCNHDGSIDILEFVNGIRRLRGNRFLKSDIVSIDLMVRGLQLRMDELHQELQGRCPPTYATSSVASPEMITKFPMKISGPTRPIAKIGNMYVA